MAQRVPSATATLSDDCWVTWLSVAPVLRWEIYGNLTHGLFWHQKDEDLVELWVLGASSQEKTETIPSSKPCLHMFTPTHPEALPSAIYELVISCYIFVYRFVYLVYLVYFVWYPTVPAVRARRSFVVKVFAKVSLFLPCSLTNLLTWSHIDFR